MLKRFATLQPLQLPLCLSDADIDTPDPPVAADCTTPSLGFGLWLWATMTAAISIVAVIQPRRCISWIYRQAAEAWATAAPLYAPGLHGFLYFPKGTQVYGPFALLPQPLDSHAWHLFLSAGLVLAVRRYAHTLAPGAGAAAAGRGRASSAFSS